MATLNACPHYFARCRKKASQERGLRQWQAEPISLGDLLISDSGSSSGSSRSWEIQQKSVQEDHVA
jgi:hypothetical protein